jgi:EAL domain-containing protein (putative c-di-GMP-specific phosphodiesterase class I)/DNA-binding CsgD family transcriptional regulator
MFLRPRDEADRASHPSNHRWLATSDESSVRRAGENDLRRAIGQGEFVVHFQRQIAFGSGRLVGFEALVRRQSPTGQLIAPNAFIPLAERTGLIVPLGQLILETACRQLTAIHRQLPPSAPLPWVAVNFSSRQFESPEVVDNIIEVLNATGLDPDLLWIEITETALMHDANSCVETLRRIRSLGVHMSIDDFGTGCSSLGQLKVLPVEQLKIDRSFTCGVGLNDVDTSIVVSIITLAHSLGMHTVAEGVETFAQRDLLVALGCDVGQGFLWGKAMPFDEPALCQNATSDSYNYPARFAQFASYGQVAMLNSTAIKDRLPTAELHGRLSQLPDRPREVVCRLVRGQRVAGIASAMYVSRSTVRNHLSHAFRHFGVSGQEDLVRLFLPSEDHARLMQFH